MIEPRLASSVQISALVRMAQAEGDFATVLRKGHPVAGAIILIGLIRGQNSALFERYPSLDGGSPWHAIAPQAAENEADITARWQRRAARDPDLWVIELDVASPERLAGLLAAST